MKKLDAFITLIIFLVLIQTFLEELALILGWSVAAKNLLIITGLFFDLFFTLEFLIRFFTALSRREGRHYFFHRRGWIDFFAALPLLLLDSGPRFYALVAGGGMLFSGVGTLNILKSVKATRLARILRFLRVLKLFRNIKHVDSRMAQRHLARIATLSVASIVFASLFYGTLVSLFGLPTTMGMMEKQQEQALELAVKSDKSNLDTDILLVQLLSDTRADLLLVRERDQTLFSRFDNSYYEKWFSPEDYRVSQRGEYNFFFDMRYPRAVEARERLLIFVVVILLLLGILFLYGPHFAVTVTDPIHVMRRGFTEDDYSLEVKIDPRFPGDDIFHLAEKYNQEYLPMKARERMESSDQSSALSLDALGDLADFSGLYGNGDDVDKDGGGGDSWS